MRAEHVATARTRPTAVKIDTKFLLGGECISIRSDDIKPAASCSESSVSAMLLANSYLERSLKGNISAREGMLEMKLSCQMQNHNGGAVVSEKITAMAQSVGL